VSVQPVIEISELPPTDAYEIRRRIREAIFLQMPASCFPYGATTGRRMDLDHTRPYRPPSHGGPPGETALHNLGPLSRSDHRLKTHSRWRVRQPTPGGYLWRSPHDAYFLVTNAGTLNLGDDAFGRTVWRAATAPINSKRKERPLSTRAWPTRGRLPATSRRLQHQHAMC